MNKGSLFICYFILIISSVCYAQDNDRVFTRRLVWSTDEHVWRYAVEVDKAANGIFGSLLRDYTSTSNLLINITAGEYRFRIIPHDILDRPGEETQWMYFDVRLPVANLGIHASEETAQIQDINISDISSAVQSSHARQIDIPVISDAAGWKIHVDGGDQTVKAGTTAEYQITRELIQGQERNVLTMTVNLAKGNTWRDGLFSTNNIDIKRQLLTASGVRFKVLGDGKSGWEFRLATYEAITDFCWHRTLINTRNNQVVQFDIPYSRLRQPAWGKQVQFNKNDILYLEIARLAEGDNSNTGSSTIKIFDFEIY